MLQTQSKHESSLKEKITAAASAVEQLASDKDTQISELIKERDEAIRVTLQMKKNNANLEAEKLNSDGKIQTLLQIQNKHESSLKEKITAAASAVEQLASDKDTQISKLIKERDEAIRVTLQMKKNNANLEAKISQIDQNTNAKIEALQLTKEQTERALEDSKRELDDLTNKVAHLNDDLKREKESFTNFKIEQKQIQVDLKEKLTAAASELTDVKSLTSDRDGKINRLVHDRDDAIKVTLEMKKANADLEAQKLELDKKIQTLIQTQNNNESLSKDKIAAAAAALLAAQKLTADRDTNIETLINERDEAIKVTLEMKKTAEDFEAQKLELDGKIQTLMQSQSDNESTLNEKITTSNSKLEEAQKIVLDKDTEIASLLAERDDAIKVTLEMKKANANLEAQKLELDGKAQTLIQSQSDNESILNEKITTSNSKLEEAQKIVLDKDTEIASLLAERDDAIKVTLEMKKANTDLEAQKSELNGKIQTLLQTQSKHESSLKDKITAAATAVEQLTSDKDTQISKLIKERDEAIKVTLEMKRASADLESQKSELDGKIQTLMQTESENKSSAKEKIANLATLITKAEQLALAKDEDVAKLIKERDSAIQVSIGMKKEYEAQKIDLDKQIATLMQEKTQNKSLSNEKISKLAVLLEEAEKAIVEHDTDIERLTKERDAAIQVTVGMQKKLEDSAQKIKQEKLESAQNAKKLVIDNIVNTFKLSKVEFKTGSAILTKKSTILLDKVADIMKAHSEYNYKVQGHTDSQGKKEFNLRLSEDRAKSVKDYLISKGVSDNQLSSEGFGSLIPIADNTTAEGRLKNRRVVFEIVD